MRSDKKQARGTVFLGILLLKRLVLGLWGGGEHQAVGWEKWGDAARLSLRSWEKWGMVTQSLLHLVRSSVETGSGAPGICGASRRVKDESRWEANI